MGYIKESTAIEYLILIMIISLKYKRIKSLNIPKIRKGFSLAEVMVAMTIGSMILVAVLSIYNRAEKSAASVTRKIQSSRLSSEVLQRIAEDLDRIISTGSDTTITIENKNKNGFPAAKLTITKTIKDSKNTEQKFEEIVWQSLYDYESPIAGLVLYRGYSGIALEDKLLDKSKDDLELNRSVPICNGITFFKINALNGGVPVEKWNSSPPPGITATISFAEPFKRANGSLDVLDEEKITRTIAIDRTRKIKFTIEAAESSEDEKDPAQEKLPDDKSSQSRNPKISEPAKR